MSLKEINFSIPAGKVKQYAMDELTTDATLDALGVHFEADAIDEFRAFATDALPNLQTAPSMMTEVEFLRFWIPDLVEIVTESRDADNILGRDFAGSWEDEEIAQRVIEYSGQARPYGDKTSLNLANFNVVTEKRTIVRFEQDVEVGKLEALRSAKMKIDAMSVKRKAAALSLAINMNDIAFYGYNGGVNKTYGLLNEPSLPAYVTLPQGAAKSTKWADKDFVEITSDIKTMVSALRIRSGNNFKPESDAFTLALPVAVVDCLQTVNALGSVSVIKWIKDTYPNCRIASAVQLDSANTNQNVIYVIADKINGMKVMNQFIQDTLRLVGVEQKSKGTLESYSNATAGVLLRVPVGVVRFSGC